MRISNAWWIGMTVVSFAVGGVMGHDFLNRTARRTLRQAEDTLSKFDAVTKENGELNRKLAIAKSSNKIDRIALEDVQTELGRLQESLAKARKELDFYRRIVSPDRYGTTLHIKDFRIVKDPDLRFLLALSQGPGNESFVGGRVHLTIDGDLNGQRIALDMNQLGQPHNFTFKFRHFELLSGKIRLPKGFSPISVEVRVIPNAKEMRALISDWAWDDFDIDRRT